MKSLVNSIDTEQLYTLMQQEETIECPLTHHFIPGVYVREGLVLKDTLILGKAHKYKGINILSKGRMLVVEANSGNRIEIVAPYTFITEAGVQKILYALEDCVFSNILSNPENIEDLEEIEEF